MNENELEELEADTEDEAVEEAKEVKQQKREAYKVGNKQFDDYAEYVASMVAKHLEEFAATDEHFAECMKKENKNFEQCMVYVINCVWKDKTQTSDDACYQNARHYYLEDNIAKKDLSIQYRVGGGVEQVKSSSKGKAELSDKEREKIEREAVEKYKAELRAKEDAKKEAERKAKEEAKAEALKNGAGTQTNLFDFL